MNRENTMIYWSSFQHNDWKFYIAATSKGLCYVGSPNQPFEELSNWIRKKFPGSKVVEDQEKLWGYVTEIIEFLEGKRITFDSPVDVSGTEFQKSVWQALCEIPYGETRSYADIAETIKNPKAVRAVGSAIGANPVLLHIPCHRVIGKNGALTGFRAGLEMKKRLLELEGVYK